MSAFSKPDGTASSGSQAGLLLLLLTALLVAFLATWPLISQPGLINTRGGGDSPFLLQRVQQMETAIRDGHIPVRWMRDANYGFGYPFFNYYAPLSIYVAAIFRLLGFSIVRAIEATQLLGFLLAGSGVFFLARRWYQNNWAAMLASVAYTTAPFHLVNVYVRGDSLAEFWAMALYPWTILAADYLLTEETHPFPHGRVAGLAIAYAALILSHNISALIFTPFLLLYIGLCWLFPMHTENISAAVRFSMKQSRPYVIALAAGALAMVLAAWFFVPALAEQGLAQLDPVTGGYFHFANHFRGADLLQTSLLFSYNESGGNAFRLGFVQALATIAAAAALILVTFRLKSVEYRVTLFILLTAAISTLMITPLSRVLWDNVPLLPFTQFPWRFLSIQAFAGALAIGCLALLPYCRVITIGTALILIITSFTGLKTDQLLLSDSEITAEALAEYEWYTGNIGSTISAEYLPFTVQPRFYSSEWLNSGERAPTRALAGELVAAELLGQRTADQRWRLRTGDSGATVMLPTMFWPGWEASLDGRALESWPAPGSGQIVIEVPSGEHEVVVKLGRTNVRLFAELLSVAALLIILYLLIKARRSPEHRQIILLTGSVVIILLLLFRFWPEEDPSVYPQSWDFAQMPYLHHSKPGIRFSSGTTLLGYDYSRETVPAGQELTINLSFSEVNNDTVRLDLATPAHAWPAISAEPPVIVTQDKPLAQQQVSFHLQVPENAPDGLFVPRLRLDVGRPLTSSGDLRGDLYLRPLRVANDQPAQEQVSDLDVKVVAVELREPDTLEVQLAWATRRQLSHNYVTSLLLLDQSGNWLAQLDTQPGYGLLPSSEWRPEMVVNDWLSLDLPDDLPQETPLALVARLYEVGSGEIVLTRRLGEINWLGNDVSFDENQPVYALPPSLIPLAVQFDRQIQLLGYELQAVDDGLWQLTLYWQSLAPAIDDAQRFVHVFDPANEEIVFQNDGHPRHNSYPLSQWVENEIVADTMLLPLDTISDQVYKVGVGFYRQADGNTQRLTAVDELTGEAVADDRVLLPETIRP